MITVPPKTSAADPMPHPLRIDEQLLNIENIPGAEPGGKADDVVIGTAARVRPSVTGARTGPPPTPNEPG